MTKAFTYILKCSDGSLYAGFTTDLEKRLKAHNSGKGAKYTRGRLPVEYVFFQEFSTKEEAMQYEAKIKTLTRAEKEKIILEGADLVKYFENRSGSA